MSPTKKLSSPTPSEIDSDPVDSASLPVLQRPVTAIKLIGGHRMKALAEYGVNTIGELLEFFPRKYLDRSHIVRIRDVRMTEHELTVVGEIKYKTLFRGRAGKERLVIGLHDGTGLFECLWFQGVHYWTRALVEGQWVAVSGTITEPSDRKFIHPAVDRLGEDGDRELFNTGRIIPLYPGGMPLKQVGLEGGTMRQVMHAALDLAKGALPEYLPESDLEHTGALERESAYVQIHSPDSEHQLRAAWNRIRYEELFMQQLLFALRRFRNETASGGVAFDRIGPQTRKVLDLLPFQLTDGQKAVLSEIKQDLLRAVPMQRLLQGEVGTGKTTIALLAMAMAADAGFQSAIMAPTELLAEQHAQRIAQIAHGAGLQVALLRGRQKAALRDEILYNISNGDSTIVVGTHALIQEKVQFARLGLVVIDEQHRFGVEQRTALRSKGIRPHLLLMTATPIPRSLRLAQVGDLDVSTLKELPGGARKIQTVLRTEPDRDKIYAFMVEQAKLENRIFIVCPLIEESEKVDTEAAVAYHRRVSLGPLKGVKVGLLHGRMKSEEKNSALDKFRSGETPILVTTPVIEVGVDVPEAGIMLIENAERFGLAALHQLRGRVGRKGQKGFFILLPGPKMTLEAEQRLQVLVGTDDGFVIAERDLELRGSGEFFGTRQSGEFDLRYSNPVRDKLLLEHAHERAREMVESDASLSKFPELKRRFDEKHAAKLDLMRGG